MNAESTVVKSRGLLTRKQIISTNRAKTLKLLRASFRHGAHDPFKTHMENNPVRQDFKGALKQGIELVISKTRKMSDVEPTLMVLLQNGAKWDGKVRRMPSKMTPYHVICSSTGDHQELLELLIKELGQTFINAKDEEECTALIYAVQNASIKCVKTLISNGADVNLIRCGDSYPHIFTGGITDSLGPLIDSINLLHPNSPHSYNTMMDIFDVLLDNGADVNQPCHNHKRTPIMYAADMGNVNCVEKLIQKGARLNIVDKIGRMVFTVAAQTGNVDMLKCLLEDNGDDKDSIDGQGCSVLYWTVTSGNIKAVRYLLNLGVTMTTYTPHDWVDEACRECGTNLTRHWVYGIQHNYDPGMRAIDDNLLEVVRLIDEYGCQFYEHPDALLYAIRMSREEVVDYLLHRRKYLINYEFICKAISYSVTHFTFLLEACKSSSVNTINVLLDHGADPRIPNCAKNYPNVISEAIRVRHVEVIARFIRGGLNVNTKSYNRDRARPAVVLPFEEAVSCCHFYAAKLLLVSGCSCGVHSLDSTHKLKTSMTPRIQELLMEWNVHENIALPLKQRCRMVILSHLCPQAEKKIIELPLPPQLIKYLSVTELDDILKSYEKVFPN